MAKQRSENFTKKPVSSLKKMAHCPLPMTLPPNGVKSFIQKYPLGKSPGHDFITAKIARKHPDKAIRHLTHIFNVIFRISYFPIQWKLATIIPFSKPNKPIENPSSYIPISLLPFFSKLFNKCISNRIYPIITELTLNLNLVNVTQLFTKYTD